MKNKDKKLELIPLKTKELVTIKGGIREIPVGSIAPMSRTNRWEDFEIRFGGNGGTKSNSTTKFKFQKPR